MRPSVLRLRSLFSRRAGEAYRCALVFPRYTETRFLERLPSPGARIRDHWGNSWIVTDVLQSGQRTYTVFAGTMQDYRESLHRSSGGVDLSAELLNLARQSATVTAKTRRRWRNRNRPP
jgi:hypothetical protein